MSAEATIRVVIVDDVRETRENIRKLLQFESDIEVVGTATTGREGIQLVRDVTADVVLMDINMPDMDGITATEAIRKELPHIQVVMLSVQGDPNYMRRAMLAGARDFLTKPPMVDELIAAIRRAGEMAHEEHRKAKDRYPADGHAGNSRGDFSHTVTSYGKVIVVYSPKGGVGVTMVATNLAVTLHNPETPVVLVDGNMQFGDATVVLNERGKNSVVDLAPRADELDIDVVEDVLITHRTTGMKILAAPLRPEYAENVNGEHFAKILAQLRRQYSYVIIDAQSYLSDVILSAFDASSLVILLATQDIPAINNARLFLDLSEIVGLERDRIIFILNKYDKRISITPEAIGDNLRQPVALTIPLDTRVVVPSVNRGVPFILSDKKRPISRSILDLAEMVRLKLAEIEAAHDE